MEAEQISEQQGQGRQRGESGSSESTPSLVHGIILPAEVRDYEVPAPEEFIKELTPEEKKEMCPWTDYPTDEELIEEVRKRRKGITIP